MWMRNGERCYAQWLPKDHALLIEAVDAKRFKIILGNVLDVKQTARRTSSDSA
jgi:hypothetical protein